MLLLMVWINVLNLFLFFRQEPSRGYLWLELEFVSVITVNTVFSTYRDFIFWEPYSTLFFLVSKSPFFFSNRRSNVLWNNAKPPIPKFLLQGFIRFEIVCITAADLELA